jgi:hypothetical protein
MWRHVAFVWTDVSVENIATIIRMERISELWTTLAVTSNWNILRSVFQLLVTANIVSISLILSTLMMGATRSSETSVLTRATRRHIPAYSILHSKCQFACVDIIFYTKFRSLQYLNRAFSWCRLEYLLHRTGQSFNVLPELIWARNKMGSWNGFIHISFVVTTETGGRKPSRSYPWELCSYEEWCLLGCYAM